MIHPRIFRSGSSKAFTLIELSITLVVIGLLVGGVLVGRDLIKAAETRAQISQIEKYQAAANTFKSKFNFLPGDMTVNAATQYGFTIGFQCDGTQGRRDGNGLIDGWASILYNYTVAQSSGETELFWADLSGSAGGKLIDFTSISSGCYQPGPGGLTGSTVLPFLFPKAAIGGGNYVYVYETNGINWYGLMAITHIDTNGSPTSSITIPVGQAYAIDRKIDDANPLTGVVQAKYVIDGATVANAPNALSASATTCFDTTSGQYSITQNNGTGMNCALSFKFQ